MSRRAKIVLIVIIAVLLLLAAGGYFGYRYYQKNKAKKTSESSQQTNATNNNSSNDQNTSGNCASTLTQTDKDISLKWKTYTNPKYNYSFKYPENWGEADTGTETNEIVSIVGMENPDDDPMMSSDLLFVSELKIDQFLDTGDMNKIDSKLVKVDCANAEYAAYEIFGGESEGEAIKTNERIAVDAVFTKDSKKWLVRYTFPDFKSASLNSDYYETFDIILKTIKFN